MTRPTVGVVGDGVVGAAMRDLLGSKTVVYDTRPGAPQDRQAINRCDIAFVCVPSPMQPDGSCDTSIVTSCVAWIESPLIVLRSTVPPGTTDRLRSAYGKRVIFQPEYLGETPSHVFAALANRQFIVLGGPPEDTSAAADLYKHYYNSMVRFHFCDAVTAELAKYMENCFYAVKVTFVNAFYDLARAYGVNFDVLREVWLADTRISRDHTFVFPDQRGFSGKCLPKDVSAIVHSCLQRGVDPKLLRAVLSINDEYLALNEQRRAQTPRPLPAEESLRR